MKLLDLEKEALEELEAEKVELAREIIKERIKEIKKIEYLLAKLKLRYQEMLEKSVDDVVQEIENEHIRL